VLRVASGEREERDDVCVQSFWRDESPVFAGQRD